MWFELFLSQLCPFLCGSLVWIRLPLCLQNCSNRKRLYQQTLPIGQRRGGRAVLCPTWFSAFTTVGKGIAFPWSECAICSCTLRGRGQQQCFMFQVCQARQSSLELPRSRGAMEVFKTKKQQIQYGFFPEITIGKVKNELEGGMIGGKGQLVGSFRSPVEIELEPIQKWF